MNDQSSVARGDSGAASRRGPLGKVRRTAFARRHQVEDLVQRAQDAARSDRWRPARPAVYLFALFLIVGLAVGLDIILTLPPTASRNQIAFLFASGFAVWGLVGLIVIISRRRTPDRQAGLVAYDAFRQGLLVAGCLELNLATRILDLWTPLIGGLLIAVFALFEIVTLGRRPT